MISLNSSAAGSGVGASTSTVSSNNTGSSEGASVEPGGEGQGTLSSAFSGLVAALREAAHKHAASAQTAAEAGPRGPVTGSAGASTEPSGQPASGASPQAESAAGVVARPESAQHPQGTSLAGSTGITTRVLPQATAAPAAASASAVAPQAQQPGEARTAATKPIHSANALLNHPGADRANVQPQSAYAGGRMEAAQATAASRPSPGGPNPSPQPILLAAARQENVQELFAAAQPGQRNAAQPAAPLATGSELRLDGVQQLARTGQAEWAPVKVDTQNSQWSRDLVAALGDRLSMQLNQNVKEATVRLDPPDMGRIELVVRIDGDRLNVQLNASHTGVRDLLTQHAERLRNDLLQQNLQTVDVQVGQQSQRDRSGQYQAEPESIAANFVREPEQELVAEDNNDRWLSTSA